jgi:hypothetical protein
VNLSARERHYKALSLQGKLTADEIRTLTDDLLRLLNGKKHPKSETQLQQELVRFCGWNRNKVFGPRPYVENCLDDLERADLIESHYEAVDLLDLRRTCWRRCGK